MRHPPERLRAAEAVATRSLWSADSDAWSSPGRGEGRGDVPTPPPPALAALAAHRFLEDDALEAAAEVGLEPTVMALGFGEGVALMRLGRLRVIGVVREVAGGRGMPAAAARARRGGWASRRVVSGRLPGSCVGSEGARHNTDLCVVLCHSHLCVPKQLTPISTNCLPSEVPAALHLPKPHVHGKISAKHQPCISPFGSNPSFLVVNRSIIDHPMHQ